MPAKPKHPCRATNCPRLVEAGAGGYCESHAHLKAPRSTLYDQHRPSAHARGYDARWQKVRADVLRAQPYCDVCGATATEVHHVVPIHDGGDVYNWDNLRPLCHRCHMRSERETELQRVL